MKHHNSSVRSPSLNWQNFCFPLGEYLTTRKLRSLIQEICDAQLSAREIEQKGKSGRFEILWEYGVLVVTPAMKASPNRLLHWDLHCLPSYFYPGALSTGQKL
jgi:hypothetical protein